MSNRKTLVYLAIFVAVAIVVGGAYRIGDWTIESARCRMHREPHTFLAYCTEPHYGFYEHGAYWFDLQPDAIERLKKAEVIFLGNSRAQFGFSTDKIREYFRQRSIPYYVMGFSYGESAYFAIAMIEKYQLKPKVLVIDADPFFNTGYSNPANAIFDQSGSWLDRDLRWVSVRWDYLTRHYFNLLQPSLCAIFGKLICTSEFKAIYRSEYDGMWIWRDVYAPPDGESIPNEPKNAVIGVDIAIDLQYEARRFMSRISVPPECVVITQVPNSVHEAKTYTYEMGKITGAQVVFPELSGLSTIDSSHLNWTSAQRWSEAFLKGADPIITRCTSSRDIRK